MKIIALTGGIASGKNYIADIFKQKYNIPIIDADHIVKDILNPDTELFDQNLYNKILDKFGKQILDNNKNSNNIYYLDKKKIRELVFNNKDNKKWLENLLHPIVNQTIRKLVEIFKNNISNNNYIIIIIPILNQAYLDNNKYIDKIIVVDCDEQTQLKRAQSRDSQSEQQIKAIINNQITRKERNGLADDIIINNDQTSHQYLEQEVDELHLKYNKNT